ncbi:Cyclopropane-fatty-acyl-phospholipid synthase [Pleurostoma richardsiae]|uniref:Cyclopropane-fatty-acyl-phospholipid synthase n=1 Tax=Pleurostoma richardsiae TaxID=41990 RepID=A0AA38S091_9PEZI|nr:Cyclopropane-fatty-acyl-phospholipid synthase [Pleurostoma richardsiae]
MTALSEWVPWTLIGPLLAIVAYGVFGGPVDIVLFSAIWLYTYQHETMKHLAPELLGPVLRTAGCCVLAFAIFQLARSAPGRKSPKWPGPGKVLLFQSRTDHSRLFPKRHSFSYSYLVVGIPVDWTGCAGGMISSGVETPTSFWQWLSSGPNQRRGWYDIVAADYLERGRGELGLRGKLDVYLKSQGADPAAYPHAYLITAPKFLGYHFNPVSFWYLYGPDMSLDAMILEVNNTFSERRMYFLTPEVAPAGQTDVNSPTKAAVQASEKAIGDGLRAFKQAWPKDFHVSPFNSRKGSYSLSANDPLKAISEGKSPINIMITLVSSKDHAKLVTRLVADGPPIDPLTMRFWQKCKFLISWCWVGFATFPRIVKQAAVLYFGKNLHVWYRPEPLKESLGREADTTERRLEVLFRLYLRHLVDQCKTAIAVQYIPAGISESSTELMCSPSARGDTSDCAQLDFKVLTPVFYTGFVYYAHDLEAFFSELRENHTVWVSQPDLLPKLIFRAPSPPLATSSYLDFACFRAIQHLRHRPERIERPMTSSSVPSKTHVVTDIRGFRISAMDAYFLNQGDTKIRRAYRDIVLKLFIAEKVAFGSVAVLEAQHLILRACLAGLISTLVGATAP